MNIGIIGNGVVGSACAFGFRKVGHKVFIYDKDLDRSECEFDDLHQCKIVYICVPTPTQDGVCDTTIVDVVLAALNDIGYRGIAAIKSTVPPGTTESIMARMKQSADIRASGVGMRVISYGSMQDICFVPEFLRERCATTDFVEMNNLLVIGSKFSLTVDIVTECHGDLPKEVMQVTPTQAELIKYYNNCLGALRVVFANEFYDLCSEFDEEYTPVKKGMLRINELPDKYFDVNENCRGYSSICWNKDLPALQALAKHYGVEMPMLDTIIESNDRYKKTPFAGTRETYDRF